MTFSKLLSGILMCLFVYGCVQPSDNVPGTDTGTKRNPAVTPACITDEDLRYVDLMVPEYAEVILYHEEGLETIELAECLIAYFQSNHASVEKHAVARITDGKYPEMRNFYIDFIGDHRYVVRIYNPTKR